jgi:membrane-associated phospholipid phosphatase
MDKLARKRLIRIAQIAISLVIVAAHWLSDAVAGVMLGTSFALVSAIVVHFLRLRIETTRPSGLRSNPDTG